MIECHLHMLTHETCGIMKRNVIYVHNIFIIFLQQILSIVTNG